MSLMDVFTGGRAEEATAEGARIQAEAAERALAELRRDLSPYVKSGYAAADTVGRLSTDPTRQTELLQRSPIFRAMLDEQNRNIMSQSAARGKLGSGGTLSGIQSGTLGLGGSFLDDEIARYMPLLRQGQAAATGQATMGGGFMTDSAAARAAGITGAAQAQAQGAQNLTSTGMSILSMFSDEKLKQNIKRIGWHNELPVYSWEWNTEAEDFGLEGKGIGHIAQELEETHPHLVTEFNGVKMVNYGTSETVEPEVWR